MHDSLCYSACSARVGSDRVCRKLPLKWIINGSPLRPSLAVEKRVPKKTGEIRNKDIEMITIMIKGTRKVGRDDSTCGNVHERTKKNQEGKKVTKDKKKEEEKKQERKKRNK